MHSKHNKRSLMKLLLDHLADLCEYGGRIPGSVGYQDAQCKLNSHFEQLDFSNNVENYEVELMVTERCRMSLCSQERYHDFECVPYPGAVPYHANEIELKGKYITTDRIHKCKDKLLVLDATKTRQKTHWEMVKGFYNGAAGFIIVVDGDNVPAFCAYEEADILAFAALSGKVPAVVVSPEISINEGDQVYLDVCARPRKYPASNLLYSRCYGVLPRIVLCAHYDSDWNRIDNPGAYDNGAGVALLLVLAELMNEDPSIWPGKVTCSFSGSEELNNLGPVFHLIPNKLATKEFRWLLFSLQMALATGNDAIQLLLNNHGLFEYGDKCLALDTVFATVEVDGVGSGGEIWLSSNEKEISNLFNKQFGESANFHYSPGGSGADGLIIRSIVGKNVISVLLGDDDKHGVAHSLRDTIDAVDQESFFNCLVHLLCLLNTLKELYNENVTDKCTV